MSETLAPFRIVSRIYEADKNYHAVVHIFYGQSMDEAYGYLRAHMKTDVFFQMCALKKHFGNFKCREERVKQRWDGKVWVTV